MKFDPHQVMALLVATSFAAGLNVYATVATLGLLGHYHVLPLPDRLDVLSHWSVISVATALFVIEFFADKIPYFDMVWNVMHTFVRIPIAALLAWNATASLPPSMQVAATVLGGVIAGVAHTGKTAVRAGVTPSPEPVSNMAMSTAEDVGAIGLTWLATKHPYIAGGITLVFIVFTFLVARWIVRSLREGWKELKEGWA
jgi:hypothetical protein